MPARDTFTSEGYTLLELLLVVSTLATLVGFAIPIASGTVDDLRAAGAARHMAARIATIRLDAVRRATTVSLRFDRRGTLKRALLGLVGGFMFGALFAMFRDSLATPSLLHDATTTDVRSLWSDAVADLRRVLRLRKTDGRVSSGS